MIILQCVSKKFPPFNSLLLCQILTDFQNFCSAGKRMKFAIQIPYDVTHLTLGTLLQYPWKLKIQILCRYSADIEENANNLHFKYTNFKFPTRVTVYSECIYVFFQNLVLVA